MTASTSTWTLRHFRRFATLDGPSERGRRLATRGGLSLWAGDVAGVVLLSICRMTCATLNAVDVLDYRSPSPPPPRRSFGLAFWLVVIGIFVAAYWFMVTFIPLGQPRR
jgi:hypothetical protein